MTGAPTSARLPMWMRVVLFVEALAAAAMLYIVMLIGSTYPMPGPGDPHSIWRLVMPLVAVPIAYLLCRAALRRERHNTAALMLFLPVAALLFAIR